MKRGLVVALVLAAPRLAAAEPHKLLVLQSDGRADRALRVKIDAAITRLATAADPQAAAGELTFIDAATAVGCKPETPSCKDDVLGMLAVDEIVITTVMPKPGGVEIAVRRIARGGASRDATMLLATGASPDKLDAIATLFGDKPAPSLGPQPPQGPAIAPVPSNEPVVPPPTFVEPPPQPVPATAPPLAAPIAEQPSDGHRLEFAGMIGGAASVTLGLVLWAAASSVQNDIDHAPTSTRQNLSDLKDLESKGDTYAALGNVLTISGLVVGGIATYLYLRDRRSGSTTSARLTPTVLDHGAGLVLTIGAAP